VSKAKRRPRSHRRIVSTAARATAPWPLHERSNPWDFKRTSGAAPNRYLDLRSVRLAEVELPSETTEVALPPWEDQHGERTDGAFFKGASPRLAP
jgi:hypothetical protein